MEYRRLGRSDIRVSSLCLGSMTWGEQNSEAEGHAQLDRAFDRGINFIDTAEMYAVPTRAETQGESERIIGSWIAGGAVPRDRIVLATKVAGRSDRFTWIRGSEPTRLDRQSILAACDASLQRLRTDYIDLYQLHWPDRPVNKFGQLDYEHSDEDSVPLEESLAALGELVAAGKVRLAGVSNETPWGTMECLRLSESAGLPRIASIQNPYNLLNRTFEIGLSEIALCEDVGLLAYGALGSGTLSGKYLDGVRPAGTRMALFPDYFPRYLKPRAQAATARYVALARRHGLDPAQMALAFVVSRPFVTSVIIGETSRAQLDSNIDAAGLVLAQDVQDDIAALHREDHNPCP